MKNCNLSAARIFAANNFIAHAPFIPTIDDESMKDFQEQNVFDEDTRSYISILELSRKHPDLVAKLPHVEVPSTSTKGMSDEDLFATAIHKDDRNFMDLANAAEGISEQLDKDLSAAAETKPSKE